MSNNHKKWSLFDEVNKNNRLDYKVYRCPDPVAVKTGEPWYTYENICPCSPELSNVTGRGYTACTFGIDQSTPPRWMIPFEQLYSQIPESSQITGSLYQQHQYVPPQLDPRPLTQIGVAWRSAN